MRPTRSGVRALCCIVTAFFAVPILAVADERPSSCGTTTLDATITDADGDGVLECGPGQDVIVRSDLAKRGASRAEHRTPIISFLLMADFQLADEELTLPARSDWRGYPALLPHMLNAQIAAANRVAAQGGPVLGGSYDMAFALGDLADNAQLNETRLMIDLMDGRQVVDPDSGADGYHGQKSRDPRGAGNLRSPVRGERILDLANEPFYAQGLRNADGSPIPWYAVHGNHDTKVMGGIPHEHPSWRKAANGWATGDKKVFRLNAALQAELHHIREHAMHDEPGFWMRVFERVRTDPASVGDVRTIPRDAKRRILSKAEWVEQLRQTAGVPRGHGFAGASQRCPDVYEDEHFRRACYAFDHGRFRFIALDDNPLGGYTTGSVDKPQFEWLERQLVSASSSYFDEDGRRVPNPDATDRYVIVLSHHSSKGMTNEGTKGTREEFRGEHLEELLLRFPNVIVHANGHSHSNKLWPRADERNGTQYWEINTASVADHPHNGRSVEIADNGDGTLSIYGVLFESGVHPNPRSIGWTEHDHTDETKLGDEPRAINEDWLAAAGLEQAAAEREDRRYGNAADRNVELVLRDPLAATTAVASEAAVPDDIRIVAVASIAVAILAWLLNRRRRPRVPPMRPLPAPRRTAPRRERVPAGRSRRPAA